MFIGKDKPKYKIKDLVQILNPRIKRYVLVDTKNANILSYKRDNKPYKNIPIKGGK